MNVPVIVDNHWSWLCNRLEQWTVNEGVEISLDLLNQSLDTSVVDKSIRKFCLLVPAFSNKKITGWAAAIIENGTKLQVISIFTPVMLRNHFNTPYGKINSIFCENVDAYFYWAEPNSEVHSWIQCNALPWYSAFSKLNWTPLMKARPRLTNTWCPDLKLHKDQLTCPLCNLYNSMQALGNSIYAKPFVKAQKAVKNKAGVAQFHLECGLMKKTFWRLPHQIPERSNENLAATWTFYHP